MGLSFTEKEELQARRFQDRLEQRRRGTFKPEKLPERNPREPSLVKILVIGDSHAHPDVSPHRFKTLGRLIRAEAPDAVVDIGDSADMPSLHEFEKARPTAIIEGFNGLWRDVEAYYRAQEALMNELHRRGGSVPTLLKTQGNHEYRITKLLKHEPRLRGFVDETILREEEYGWQVTPYNRLLVWKSVGFCHLLPGGSSKTGPRGVVTAKPGTSGTYLYGHTHRRGIHCYSGLHPNHGTIINVGCYFPISASSHRWAGDDVKTWHPGIQIIEVDRQGRLRNDRWLDYDWIQAKFK